MNLLILNLLFSLNAQAGVHFHCYSVPNMPVQTYEYGSSNCGPTNKKTKSKGKTPEKKIGENGAKEILCMYQAGCMPVAEAASVKEPPDKNITELTAMMATHQLKMSVIVCKGEGQLKDGEMVDTQCPTVSKCQKDIFYNFVARTLSPGVSIPADIQPGAK